MELLLRLGSVSTIPRVGEILVLLMKNIVYVENKVYVRIAVGS